MERRKYYDSQLGGGRFKLASLEDILSSILLGVKTQHVMLFSAHLKVNYHWSSTCLHKLIRIRNKSFMLTLQKMQENDRHYEYIRV